MRSPPSWRPGRSPSLRRSSGSRGGCSAPRSSRWARRLASRRTWRWRRRRCSTSPTIRPASSTRTSTWPSTSTGRPRATPALEIKTSHGGSGAQARAVIDGLDAQVVTLALASDVDAIAVEDRQDPGRLADQAAAQLGALHLDDRLPGARRQSRRASRTGATWSSDGVEVITPNPKTSGGARWNYLAAWAWADKKFGGNQDQIRDYMHDALRPRPGARHRRPRLDHHLRAARHRRRAARLGERGLPGARRSSATDQFEIVYPSISILAEPTVALVDGNINSRRAAARRRRPTSTGSTAPRARRSR